MGPELAHSAGSGVLFVFTGSSQAGGQGDDWVSSGQMHILCSVSDRLQCWLCGLPPGCLVYVGLAGGWYMLELAGRRGPTTRSTVLDSSASPSAAGPAQALGPVCGPSYHFPSHFSKKNSSFPGETFHQQGKWKTGSTYHKEKAKWKC